MKRINYTTKGDVDFLLGLIESFSNAAIAAWRKQNYFSAKWYFKEAWNCALQLGEK